MKKHMNHCKHLIVYKYSTPARYLNRFLDLLLELNSYGLYCMFVIVLNLFPTPALHFICYKSYLQNIGHWQSL